MADEKEPGFKVSDRRLFNVDGTPRESTSVSRNSTEEATDEARGEAARVISFPGEKANDRAAAAKSSPAKPAPGSKQSRDASQLPQASLEGLVNMLAVEAVMHLGLIENPMGGHGVDLEAARHVIDMLGVVQTKTQGNLTDDEAELLSNVLSDLRMQFVAISRGR